jgi:histidine triad (HIT) family protein
MENERKTHRQPACIFCQIVEGRAEASLVYRDNRVTGFLDIRPVNPGHLLVIPNEHCPALADLDPAVGAAMFVAAQRLGAALRDSGIRCQGLNFYLADGTAAGQEVLHIHLHIVPRFTGDGFGIRRTRLVEAPVRQDLESIAHRIRASLDRQPHP